MEIIISGTVGVGKSTIARNIFNALREQNKEVFMYDEVKNENPFLSYYYGNRPAWSFLIQIDFLMSRFKAIIENKGAFNADNKVVIWDRHFLDDLIFANLKSVKEDMSSFQWNTYKVLNDELTKKISDQKPDFIFLLKVPFEKILRRVVSRSREEEQEVDLDYWRDLYFQYYENEKTKKYLEDNSKKLIVLDATKTPEELTKEILIKIK